MQAIVTKESGACGGYVVEATEALVLTVFSNPASAVAWALRCRKVGPDLVTMMDECPGSSKTSSGVGVYLGREACGHDVYKCPANHTYQGAQIPAQLLCACRPLG